MLVPMGMKTVRLGFFIMMSPGIRNLKFSKRDNINPSRMRIMPN